MTGPIILDGKALAKKIRKELKTKTKAFQETPGLAVILVGENPASKVYVSSKQKKAKALGWHSVLVELPSETTKQDLTQTIESLNKDESIHGILLQLPLPDHLSADDHIPQIVPHKDVDGFHPINVGKLALGWDGFVPCTPLGVIRILEEYDIPILGQNVVVIGRSMIVGHPMAELLLKKRASVSILHSKTKDMKEYTRNADIIVSATGILDLIGPDHLGRPCTLIDVGITRKDDGSLAGDLQYAKLLESPHCKAITPVPGGVGPMTIAMLLENTLKAFEASTR